MKNTKTMIKMSDNTKLKEIIKEINTNPNEELGKKLEEELLNAELLVPVIFQEEHNHEHEEDEEVPVSILPLQDEEGNIYLAAFTDETEAKKSTQEMETIIFDLESIYESIFTQQDDLKGIVINPFSQYSIAPPKETITDILGIK